MGCREISSDGNLVLQKGREEKKETRKERRENTRPGKYKIFSLSLFKIHDDFEQNLLSHGLVLDSQPLNNMILYCVIPLICRLFSMNTLEKFRILRQFEKTHR